MVEGRERGARHRPETRHVAFGLGIHRCIGSNLARMEINVALSEWLARIPEFRLDPEGTARWAKGAVRGPRRLPMILAQDNAAPPSVDRPAPNRTPQPRGAV